MPDLLRQGTDWLAERLDEFAATTGIYRSPLGEVSLPVSLGASEATRTGPDGLVVERRITDALFTAARLVIDGQPREPAPGDEIEIELGGILRRLEVSSPGGDAPAWRYSDPWRIRIRCHVTEV